MAVPLIIAGGIAAVGAITKGAQKLKLAREQKKEAAALKQKKVSGKTTEAEARARAAAGQTTDTISEAQREQLDQGVANVVAQTKDVGGSSVDQLQAIQATERQRQTGEQNIGIQQAQRRRGDEQQFQASLVRTAAEENANNLAFKQDKEALLDARQKNIGGAIGNFANAGVTAVTAFGGGAGAGVANAPSAQGAGVQTMGDYNGAPQLGTIQNTHQQAQSALNAANPTQGVNYIPPMSYSSKHTTSPTATNAGMPNITGISAQPYVGAGANKGLANPLLTKYQTINAF